MHTGIPELAARVGVGLLLTLVGNARAQEGTDKDQIIETDAPAGRGDPIEQGDYLVCEDWDSGTPPDGWPAQRGKAWHGWRPAGYGGGTHGEVTASRFHSPRRCLMLLKDDGKKSTVDLSHDIPGKPSKIHVRFYLYIPSGEMRNIGSFAHFIFLNSTSSANCALDFRARSSAWLGSRKGENGKGYEWNGHLMLAPHTYNQGEDWVVETEGTPFFWEDHGDEWVLVEWMVDFARKTTSLWIDEKLYVDEYKMHWPHSSAGSITFSGFTLNTAGSVHYYIDDVVVSTQYVGPRKKGGDSERPATRPTIRSAEPARPESDALRKILLREDWNDGDAHGWSDYRFNRTRHPARPMRISNDDAHSGHWAMKWQFDTGQYESGWCSHRFASTGPDDEVHLRAYVKFDDGWVFNSGTHNLYLKKRGMSSIKVDIRKCYDIPGYHSDGHMHIGLQGYSPGEWFITEKSLKGKSTFNIDEHLGQWVCVEFSVQPSTKRIKLWINGDLKFDTIGPRFDNNRGFDAVFLSCYRWTPASRPMNAYYDDIVISTGYIGPRGGRGSQQPRSKSDENDD